MAYSIGVKPNWIKNNSFSLHSSDNASQENLQYLLVESQNHCEEKTYFWHIGVKILSKVGIEKISKLTFNFDPSYQQIVIHEIKVFRNNQWSDHLRTSQFRLLQREENLENHLYSGNLTLVYFFEDIRVGDIIEYSFSYKGENPVFSPYYADTFCLQDNVPLEKIFHRILADPNRSLSFKPFYTDLKPIITDLSPSLREWTWETYDTSPFSCETNEPAWHEKISRVEISQYKNWEEVAKKIYPFYSLPEEFTNSPCPEMKQLVEMWKNSTQDPSKRALLALHFVQDEIRYMGFEDGTGAIKPRDPQTVFKQRFGDCKDKVLLLQALLYLMDISSNPVLVSSRKGFNLDESIPAHNNFDHVVLLIELNGSNYWVDPTLYHQGGTLSTCFIHNYYWGLPISEKTTSLVSIPYQKSEKPTEIHKIFKLTSVESAVLKRTIKYHGALADIHRSIFENDGIKNTTEMHLKIIQDHYGKAVSLSPLNIIDDREKNVLTVSEEYQISTRTQSKQKLLDIRSEIVWDYFDRQVKPERSSPYALAQSLWIQEYIEIISPFSKWTLFLGDLDRKHDSFHFRYKSRMEDTKTSIFYELKNLKDHVTTASIPDYCKIFKEIEPKATLTVLIFDPKFQIQKNSSALHFIYGIIGSLFWIFKFFAYLRKKKNTTL